MTQTYWSQHGPRTLWLITLGLAAILAVHAFNVLSESAEVEDRVDDITKQLRPRPMPENPGGGNPGPHAKPGNDLASAAVERIRNRHLFMPAPPQAFRNVQGVLGDRVLYPGGQSYGIGENAMGATVVAIGTNWVELLHEGETITLDVFRGGERGPELTRWEGAPAEAGTPEEQPQLRRSRRDAEGRSERRSRWRDRDG